MIALGEERITLNHVGEASADDRTSSRLNLGCGPNPMPGYRNLDIEAEIGDLPVDDGSCDEIRASHVLEHVSYKRTESVLRHWFSKLRPGGIVKIAVPNLLYIVERLSRPTDEPIEGYLMGGHLDENDVHKAMFSEDKLRGLLHCCGYDCVETWDSDFPDCSSLPVSLNLQAQRPAIGQMNDVGMLMSMPRIAFTANMLSTLRVIHDLGTPIIGMTGCFWGQCLERIMEQALRDMPHLKYVLTVDYDSVFATDQVRIMRRLADAQPCDAVFPIQCKRDAPHAMQTVLDEHGRPVASMPYSEVRKPLLRCYTGHFGLTLIRIDALKKLPKPWFLETPDEHGGWGEGHVDPDIHFWKQWQAAGNTLYQANRVKIGHAQQVITWPDQQWRSQHQYFDEWERAGAPAWAR